MLREAWSEHGSGFSCPSACTSSMLDFPSLRTGGEANPRDSAGIGSGVA
jgi:hypothetical protein